MKIFKNIALFASAVFAFGCMPEYLEVDPNKVPQASEINAVCDVDPETNEVTLSITNQEMVPIWVIENEIVNGRKIRRRKPAIASLMFVRCTAQQATELQPTLNNQAMLYTNRGEKHPAIIPDEQMQRFISITSCMFYGISLAYPGRKSNLSKAACISVFVSI